jgi:hypothetical protein
VHQIDRVFESLPFPPCKLSSKFQFFNPHLQAVDLIGFLHISSWPAIEESGLTQGQDAD